MPGHNSTPSPSTSQPSSIAASFNSFSASARPFPSRRLPPPPPSQPPQPPPPPEDSEHYTVELLSRFSFIQVDDQIALDTAEYDHSDLETIASSFRRDRSTGTKVFRNARLRIKREGDMKKPEAMEVDLEVPTRGDQGITEQEKEKEKERKRIKREQRKSRRTQRTKELEEDSGAGRMEGRRGEWRAHSGRSGLLRVHQQPNPASVSDGQRHHRYRHPYPHQLPL